MPTNEQKPPVAVPANDLITRRIERAKQQLEHMIDLTPEAMLLVDRSGTILRANRAVLRSEEHTSELQSQ